MYSRTPASLKLRIILTLSGLVSTIHPRLKCNWWLAEAGASGAPGCQSVSPHPGDPGPWIPSASRAGTSYESLISDNCNTMAARGMGQHSYNLAENPLIMLCLLKMSSKGSVCDDANLRATAAVWWPLSAPLRPTTCITSYQDLCWGTFSDILIAPRGLGLRREYSSLLHTCQLATPLPVSSPFGAVFN